MAGDASVTLRDKLDIARAEAFLATLGIDRPIEVGTELPLFAHHAFFWQIDSEDRLGAGGQSRLPVFLPEQGLPTRAIAGGVLRQHGPLLAGVQAERTTRVANVMKKKGDAGALVFVTLRHEIKQRARPVLTEDETILFHGPNEERQQQSVSEEADGRRALKLSAVSLFRYGAVTFEADRRHYDVDYARSQGHPNVQVQEKLLAASLAAWAAEHGADLSRFTYRAEAPLFLEDVAWLCRAGDRYWVEGPKRRLCMAAQLQ